MEYPRGWGQQIGIEKAIHLVRGQSMEVCSFYCYDDWSSISRPSAPIALALNAFILVIYSSPEIPRHVFALNHTCGDCILPAAYFFRPFVNFDCHVDSRAVNFYFICLLPLADDDKIFLCWCLVYFLGVECYRILSLQKYKKCYTSKHTQEYEHRPTNSI